MITILILAFWALTGTLTFGFYFAYFQREYTSLAESHYHSDLFNAFLAGFMGPFGLLSILANGFYRHGLKFK